MTIQNPQADIHHIAPCFPYSMALHVLFGSEKGSTAFAVGIVRVDMAL
jgi:hypothetical protein